MQVKICQKCTYLLFFLLWGFVEEVVSQDQPNILLMMTDDQGYGDMGSHGNPFLKTPQLDALADEGIEFTRFYVHTLCSMTRASMMTGRDLYRTGVTEVTRYQHMMNTDEITIPEVLANSGYQTALFGKWHLGDHYPMRPTDQGFQEVVTNKAGGIGQAAGPPGNSYFNPILEHNNVSKQYEGYVDDIITDLAIDYMDEHSKNDQPFFINWSTVLPHFPLDVPDEMAEPYRKMGLHEDNARTYGMVANIDKNVGRMLAKLEELGIEDNTIVIFLSDNGPRNRRTTNDKYPGRWVDGLRGTKSTLYENGIRVPFMIRWPDRLAGGKKISDMASHIDIMPTILDAAGIEQPEVKIDGVSLLPFLEGKENSLPDRELYFQYAGEGYQYVSFTVITDQYKLIQPKGDRNAHRVHPSNSELVNMLESLELYDIKKDRSERIDIARNHPDIVEDLLLKYENWWRDVTNNGHYGKPKWIQIGTEFEPIAILSPFSWTGDRVITDSPQLGYWKVDAEAGQYEITLRFPEAEKNGIAQIRYGDHVQAQNHISKGDTVSVFNNILLPETNGNLEAYLKMDRLPVGVQFVEVELIKKLLDN